MREIGCILVLLSDQVGAVGLLQALRHMNQDIEICHSLRVFVYFVTPDSKKLRNLWTNVVSSVSKVEVETKTLKDVKEVAVNVSHDEVMMHGSV